MRAWKSVVCALIASLGLFAGSAPAEAAEIRLLSSNAMTDVLTDVVPEFERTTGHKVVAILEPTSTLMNRIKAGETADVIILTRSSLDELKRTGKIAPGSETSLARSSLGIAVQTGGPKPDISTVEAFKDTMLKAKSVAISEMGASAVQIRRIFDRLGIADAMQPKLKLIPGAARTAELAAKGEAEIAVQWMSELQGVPGAEIVGPLPGDLHSEIVLTAGLDASAKEPEAGTALIRFLTGPSVTPVLARKGMQRAQP